MTVTHITGPARGIGKAIAVRLGQDGHHIAVSDLASMEAELETARQLGSSMSWSTTPMDCRWLNVVVSI